MNTFHEVINIGNTELKLYTIYSPPHHPTDTIQKNKPADDIHEGGFYCDKFVRYVNKLNNI
jgi:oxalate decarboxylase/phosphoglucose isomerase-like protein (cupin superfamily)